MKNFKHPISLMVIVLALVFIGEVEKSTAKDASEKSITATESSMKCKQDGSKYFDKYKMKTAPYNLEQPLISPITDDIGVNNPLHLYSHELYKFNDPIYHFNKKLKTCLILISYEGSSHAHFDGHNLVSVFDAQYAKIIDIYANKTLISTENSNEDVKFQRQKQILMSLPASSVGKPPSQVQVPEKQIAFIQIIQSTKTEYDSAQDDLKKNTVRKKRNELIERALAGSRIISGWVGYVSEIRQTLHNKISVKIQLDGSNIMIGTWPLDAYETLGNTLIPRNDPLYSTLESTKEGQKVVFGGYFLPASPMDDEDDYIATLISSKAGRMYSPQFIFNFNSLQLIAE